MHGLARAQAGCENCLVSQRRFPDQQEAGQEEEAREHASISCRVRLGIDHLLGQKEDADTDEDQREVAGRRQLLRFERGQQGQDLEQRERAV